MNTMLLSQIFAECSLVASNDPQDRTTGDELQDAAYAQSLAPSRQPARNDNRFGHAIVQFREEDGMPHAL